MSKINNKAKQKIHKNWFIFYLSVKIFYLFFALFFYQKFTKLGDTHRWIDGVLDNLTLETFISSSQMMDFLGGIFSYYLGEFFAHIPFLLISFYGIYYSSSRLLLNKTQRLTLLFLLSMPSFGVWSSVAGKEAVGVFYMGIIAGYIIDMLNKERYRIKIIELLAFYLLFVFKPQYFVAIFSIILYICIVRKIDLSAISKLAITVFHITLAIIMLYVFRDYLDSLSFEIIKHFNPEARSIRLPFWEEKYDVFFKAFQGMFLAFWGPTLSEIIQKPLQLFFFLESFILCVLFIYFIFKIFYQFILTNKINVLLLSVVFMSVFWLLFAHYPFGVQNPGSALRYRTNFYGFLTIFIFYINSIYFSKITIKEKQSDYKHQKSYRMKSNSYPYNTIKN